jgi:hypothetical protein
MGVWDKIGKIASVIIEEGPGVISSIAEGGAKKQGRIYKNAEYKMKDYEQKVSKAENSDKMNNPEYAKMVNEAKQKLESAKLKMYSQGDTTTAKIDALGKAVIGGKTINQWDRQWVNLGILSSLILDDLTPYNHSVGLYKAVIGGKIYYIGRAIENNNG